MRSKERIGDSFSFMNGQKRLIVMAIVGVLLASAIIGALTVLQNDKIITDKTPTETQTTTVVSTRTSNIVTTAIKLSNSTISKGTLVTQIADLANVPSGVSNVYVTYSDIEVHTMQFGSSVWLTASPGNTVNVLAIGDNGLTISSSNLVSGYYDLARFTITSAVVTYAGDNISASILQSAVSTPILGGGINLEPNATSGFVFDIAPTIVVSTLQNQTVLELIPYAKAVAIPVSIPSSSYEKIGSTIALNSEPWYTRTQTQLANNMTVYTAIISNNVLLLVLKNTGNSDVTITGLSILAPLASTGLVTTTTVETITTVTTVTTVLPAESSPNQSTNSFLANAGSHHPGQGARDRSSSSAADSNAPATNTSPQYQTVANFLVLNNKGVVQPAQFAIGENYTQVGLTLAPGDNATLTFIGNISTLNGIYPPYSPLLIVPGQQYLLQISAPFGQTDELNLTAIAPFR